MNTIHIYPLKLDSDIQGVEIPKGARFLSVGVQDNEIFMWWQVGSETEKEFHMFRIVGTGNQISAFEEHPEGMEFLGTVTTVMFGKTFVWHIFDIVEEK